MNLRAFSLHYGAAPYLSISRAINERYCARHGIRFDIVGPSENRGKRDKLWSKVSRAKDLLTDCDALLYLDADAVFVDHEKPPTELTDRLPSYLSMLIGEDDKPGVANTGAWLIRNSADGRSILDAWDNTPNRDPSLCRRWPLDEAGFNELVMPEFGEIIELKPRSELNLMDGEYVNHFCMVSTAAKTDALARIAKRLGL